MAEKVIFLRTLHKNGNSLGMTIPPELQTWLGVKEGDEVGLCADSSKHGDFIGIWFPKKQDKEAKGK